MKLLKTILVVLLLSVSAMLLAQKAGDRVLGQWSDGFWYPATVVSVDSGIFSVSFDDGDTANLNSSKIKKLDWGVGTSVQCNWKSGGVYYTGKITTKNGDEIHVSYDDGDQEDTIIGKCRSR